MKSDSKSSATLKKILDDLLSNNTDEEIKRKKKVIKGQKNRRN